MLSRKEKKMFCPHCKREGAYARIRTQDAFCRNCGKSFLLPEEPKKEDKNEK